MGYLFQVTALTFEQNNDSLDGQLITIGNEKFAVQWHKISANRQVTDSILFVFCLFLEIVEIKRFWGQELLFVLFVAYNDRFHDDFHTGSFSILHVPFSRF